MPTNAAPLEASRPTAIKSNKKRIAIGGGAVIVVAVIIWLVVRSRTDAAPAYRFADVVTGNIQQTVSATGTLSAVKTVQVGTQVSGLVDQIHADFNDRVTKGQLLARIDPTLQQQAVTDAQAQLVKSQAQYVQAKAEYDRNQPLFAQQFISASEFSVVQVAQPVGAGRPEVGAGHARQGEAEPDVHEHPHAHQRRRGRA